MSLDESRILVQFDRKDAVVIFDFEQVGGKIGSAKLRIDAKEGHYVKPKRKQLKSFFQTHRREVTAIFRAARLTLQESCE